MSEKTEKATPHKLAEARKQGQVAQSKEIPLCVKLAVVYMFLTFVVADLLRNVSELITHVIAILGEPFGVALADMSTAILSLVLHTVGALGGALFVSTVFAHVVQTGPMIAIEALKLNGEKLNPASNLKQIITRDKLVESAVSIGTAACVGVILYVIIRGNLRSLQTVGLCGVTCGLELLGALIKKMTVSVIAFGVLVAMLDFAWHKYKNAEDQKMTKEEVKQEEKDNEGNPEIKQERRRRQKEAQSGNLAETVRKSTAVVINPTHIAVCIFYRKGVTPVPRVVLKGADRRAQQIISIALDSDVPVLRNIALAHSLNRVRERNFIPAELYRPVAELFSMMERARAEGLLPPAPGEQSATSPPTPGEQRDANSPDVTSASLERRTSVTEESGETPPLPAPPIARPHSDAEGSL